MRDDAVSDETPPPHPAHPRSHPVIDLRSLIDLLRELADAALTALGRRLTPIGTTR